MGGSAQDNFAGATNSQRGQAINASRLTRQRMLEAMRVLSSALEETPVQRESAWKKRVLGALGVLESTMEQQFAELKGREGLLAQLLPEAPRLEHCIWQLREQYDDLVQRINSLHRQFSRELDCPSLNVDGNRIMPGAFEWLV